MNTALLEEQEYISKIKAKVTDFNHEYEHMEDKNIKWEILKYEIRRLSISYSKERKRKQKEHTEVLEDKLQTLERLEHEHNSTIQNEIEKLRQNLKDIELEKANGTIIRSRAEWKEKGEKSTKYFFNLEKENYTKRTLKN